MAYQVPNYLSNSARAAKRFGGDIWSTVKKEVKDIPGKAQKAVEEVKRPGFAGDVYEDFIKNTQRTPYGTTVSAHGTDYEVKTGVGNVGKKVAEIGSDFVSDKTRKDWWKWTNPYRVVQAGADYLAPRLGLDPSMAPVIAKLGPALYFSLTETSGPLSTGLRPKGQKAAAPVSKEKDPTGATSRSIPEEIVMRYGLGQHGDLMPYSDFVKERPDVMPSTLANYRRYKSKKPAAGERLDIDTDRGAFTALGGAVRGTTRGLHDPEIRLKGIPVSANATLGIAAGLGTVRAGADFLNSGASPSRDSGWFKNIRVQPYAQKITGDPGIRQKVSRFVGDYKDPALMAAGTLAAIGTAATARKLFQKAEERRVKKEDPVEYLKYKHGNFANAKESMKQPEARNWQELSQFVN